MFQVDPSQIERLDANNLVLLLRHLLHAEALNLGVPLSGVSVPLQITVPDGGDDGRIVWHGGKGQTDFLPARTTYFQCKASKLSRAKWKKECWTKSSQRSGSVRELTPAILSLANQGGSYVGFTTDALTSDKRNDFVLAIEEGIREAGGNPGRLSKIDLYDANQIAVWATQFPAVAIWLAEHTLKQSLSGFQTIQSWGGRADFRNTYTDDMDSRYAIGGIKARDSSGADNFTTASTAWSRILEHVSQPGKLVRVVGNSGLGKSRFVYESIKSASTISAQIVQHNVVFAEYRVISSDLLPVVTKLAALGQRTLLVIDECPREVAIEMGKLVAQSGSLLSAITIDTDDQPLEDTASLHVLVSPSGAEFISAIIRTKNPKLDEQTVERLGAICGGYPRFATLAAGTAEKGASIFETADDVIDRILSGAKITDAAEVRALQCLSLFESLSISWPNPPQLDTVAIKLARMSGDEMYEHLVQAKKQELVGRKGDRINTQPSPIAINLATRRVSLMRPSLLADFICNASDDLTMSLLRRCRYLDRSSVIIEMASQLLLSADHLGKPENILTSRGASIIDALVHIVPDQVARRLDRHMKFINDADLQKAEQARPYLTSALAKLVFRTSSFEIGARLLFRLATAEQHGPSTGASELFQQLFQLKLSGTEVPPKARFAILDELIADGAADSVPICVEALERVFLTHFLRFGDTDSIGSGPSLQDWRPRKLSEVLSFYESGLKRLVKVRETYPELAERCESIIAGAARLMLSTDLYKEYAAILREITAQKGGWPEAIEKVGDWLYFDRSEAFGPRNEFVRTLYDDLLPSHPIDKAILVTKFWPSDIRDPDQQHSNATNDYEYAERSARLIAREIAGSDDLVFQTIRKMTAMDLKSVYPFADEIAQHASVRVEAFDLALDIVADQNGSMQMLRGLLHGIDVVDSNAARRCLRAASERLAGVISTVELYSALENKDKVWLEEAIADLEAGRIAPRDCAYLSYGRGVDALEPQDVALLLIALKRMGREGAWAALDIAHMYRLGGEVPPAHAEEVAKLLVEPSLLEPGQSRPLDSHNYETLFRIVHGSIGIGERFAHDIANFVTKVAQTSDYEMERAFSGPMRYIVEKLVIEHPAVIWNAVAYFYDTATPIERNRLRKLIGSDREFFDDVPHAEAGPLFGIPEEWIFEWVDQSEDRAGLPAYFYPLLTTPYDGVSTWTTEIMALAERYGNLKEFRSALGSRMEPTSWSGSIVPLVEIYLEPLASWFDHPVDALALWAKRKHQSLLDMIKWEEGLEH